MTTDINITVKVFSQWLGGCSVVDSCPPKLSINTQDLRAVRDLFERLSLLTLDNRSLVVNWGLYVQDVPMQNLISWGINRMKLLENAFPQVEQISTLQLKKLLFASHLVCNQQTIRSVKWA